MRSPADRLSLARAALNAAENRLGVSTAAPSIEVEPAPAVQPLSAILVDGRFPAGSVSVLEGSTTLLLALLAASQRQADWCAVAAFPDLGLLAASDAGVSLERLAVVPSLGAQQVECLGALLDGFTTVVVGPDAALTRSERARLLARARARDAALVSVRPWEQAALRIQVTAHRWAGPDRGAGYLRRCDLDVTRQASSAPERWIVTVPTPGSTLVPPVEGAAALQQAAARRSGALRLVG